ncbi:MAG TPA: methyltransferase domain-containing protein [Pedobacter sp.]
MNKEIQRDGQSANKIFDNRSLEKDYRTLVPLLKPGLKVLDVGCGTGAISKGIAERVGPTGHVTGIDNTEAFIISGNDTNKAATNLQLIHADLFQFETEEKFDLIVSARTLQWLSTPQEALVKMKSMLKPGGIVSILDYNHEAIEWQPLPPESMQRFYATFLRWRADAGMNNHIAEDLSDYFEQAGFDSIQVSDSDEIYTRDNENFLSKIGVWSKVAGSTQMVEEGYLDDNDRLQAIEDYNKWIETEAVSMVMKLKEVRGTNV